MKRARTWPLAVIAVPASVAIWSGWVGLGELTGFGPVNLLPGIADGLTINTAITLPIGVEAYAAYALRTWLGATGIPARARAFARASAIASLTLGMIGQAAYHLMVALGWRHAPPAVVVAVACLPVAVLGMAAALAHLCSATATTAGGEVAAETPELAVVVVDAPPPVEYASADAGEIWRRYSTPLTAAEAVPPVAAADRHTATASTATDAAVTAATTTVVAAAPPEVGGTATDAAVTAATASTATATLDAAREQRATAAEAVAYWHRHHPDASNRQLAGLSGIPQRTIDRHRAAARAAERTAS